MLSRVSISNFRCFESVTVPLRPLTVLIGQNDSGKSAFLRALFCLGNAQVVDWDHPVANKQNKLVISGETPSGTLMFEATRGGSTGWNVTPEQIRPVAMFRLRPDYLSRSYQGLPDTQGPPQLGLQGEFLSTLLDYFLRKDRDRFFAVVNAMKELVPGLADIRVPVPPDPSQRALEFVLQDSSRLPGDEVSEGVRLILFFVALAHHPSPPKLVLIEEPEGGVHPKRLKDIIKTLRSLTAGKLGAQPAQVVLTTHSPYLLDTINVREDQVLVFRRQPDGARVVEPVDADRLSAFVDEFMLGEIWFNQEEEGLVKKEL